MSLPLDGIRVIDLGQVYAAPYCTLQLAAMGADIIKIEPPVTGEVLRRPELPPGGAGYSFLMLNANKRSVTINLKRSARAGNRAQAARGRRRAGRKLSRRRDGVVRAGLRADRGAIPAADLRVGQRLRLGQPVREARLDGQYHPGVVGIHQYHRLSRPSGENLGDVYRHGHRQPYGERDSGRADPSREDRPRDSMSRSRCSTWRFPH